MITVLFSLKWQMLTHKRIIGNYFLHCSNISKTYSEISICITSKQAKCLHIGSDAYKTLEPELQSSSIIFLPRKET